ncbi:MAG TPA: hypothetical protein VK081_11545 [Planctomycetota bacterium]|nr:hypothetical protein [Planctomycetota bacterium]
MLALLGACIDQSGRDVASSAQSCMTCHNGSHADDYAGPGLENPHPFPGADNLSCTTCHGGNPNGRDAASSHVPPPPEIGDREKQRTDPKAYFNKLTLTGLDKVPDYTVDGVTYTGLDYLQFVNPGDVRVAKAGRACGACHQTHAECVYNSPLATASGFLSGATFSIGAPNSVPENRDLYEDTAADVAFRAVEDPRFVFDLEKIGAIGKLREFPVFSKFNATGPRAIHRNPAYDAANLAQYQLPDKRVVPDSPLADLFHEQVAFTCGDCHLGSAGANNRAGDYRSSGCTACHMPYSLGGRSGSRDPNVPKDEPADPDDIDEPERPHVRSHRIRSVAKTLANGHVVEGIDDHTCAGCHQGSNRTVLQYWGIRLDQNQDLRNRVQYPANPVTFRNTANDRRLFDPAVGNRTFNGRNHHQYILFEDYDGDGRDDTPADVHHEAGLGCIDCHGSHDLHGGDVNAPAANRTWSRMEQAVAIQCESCHGTLESYAPTVASTTYDGTPAQVIVDRKGVPQRHVVRDEDGHYWLTSRLTGKRHYVKQTRDVVVDTGVVHPITGQPVYSAKASYAMGRNDGDPSTGIGPRQAGSAANGFCHSDSMSCASCHAAWTNTCIGCHLKGEYNTGNNFSNITGDRIVYRQRNADFTYISPLFFQLGIGPDNKITQISANTKVFYQWRDRNGQFSQVFTFSDRRGMGNSSTYGALGHNVIMAHSIRGRVDAQNEGPRYCVACHLTTDGLAQYGSYYQTWRAAMAADDYAALDFNVLQQHFGRNPGNQLNSPLFVHMVAGLGSGVFLFDANGAPVNPLDTNANRVGAEGIAPANNFDLQRVALNLDKIVRPDGFPLASNAHPLFAPGQGPNRRDGAPDPNMCGPLGATLIRRLTDPDQGIVLDSWLDADGVARGQAGNYVQQ